MRSNTGKVLQEQTLNVNGVENCLLLIQESLMKGGFALMNVMEDGGLGT